MDVPLELEPDPRSVRTARSWIVEQLATIDREDLADSARLGVSELVTNAILHADPPIRLRLGGTPQHPRVEVHDTSVVPPSLRRMNDEAQLLATVGRGMGIVATYSTTWGAEVSLAGKVVWFEPAASADIPEDVEEGAAPTGGVVGARGVFDLSRAVDQLVVRAGEPERRVDIRLLGLPVLVFEHYRVWYDELRRELRLLALTHGTDYPLAMELSGLTLRAEQEQRQTRGREQLAAAATAGLDRVDVELAMPVSAPGTLARLGELLQEVDVFCAEQRLLTLAATPQQVRLRSWYFGEVERQGRGEPPRPWTGGYAVDDPAR